MRQPLRNWGLANRTPIHRIGWSIVWKNPEPRKPLVCAGMVRLQAFNLAQCQHETQEQGRGFEIVVSLQFDDGLDANCPSREPNGRPGTIRLARQRSGQGPTPESSRPSDARDLDHVPYAKAAIKLQDQDRDLPCGVIPISSTNSGYLFQSTKQRDHSWPWAVFVGIGQVNYSGRVVFSHLEHLLLVIRDSVPASTACRPARTC